MAAFRHITIALTALLAWSPLSAQIGVTTDIITGVVVGDDGMPVPNVLIEATSLETEITRSAVTDELGRYSILFPDGGGQYQVRARLIGMVPQEAIIERFADEDRLVWNVTLASQAVMLDEIVVQGFIRAVTIPQINTPGSQGQNVTPNLLATLPLDAADLNVLATLVPGVVGVAATDSSEASFSVAGQRPDANTVTLDGMTMASANLPQEGLRATRVITSTYDVARGRFSGGMISSISRGGSNTLQGTLNYSLRDDAIAFESSDSPFSSAFTQHQLSGGIGGPVIGNRLLAWASVQGRFRNDPLQSLTTADATDLDRLGVNPDSVSRFVDLVNQLGAAGPRTTADRNNDNITAMLRLDFLASNNHTVTARADWRTAAQEPTRIGQLALPESGGSQESDGGGLMISVASRFGLHFLNEFRVYGSVSEQDGAGYLTLPSGRVRVRSNLDDGSVGIGTLTMGGTTRFPTASNATTLQITEEISWMPGTGAHRIRLGGVVTDQRNETLLSQNALGTFTFNSLDDFANGNATTFRRTLNAPARTASSRDFAAYLGDVWRASRTVQLTYGIRVEGTDVTNAPAYNPQIETAFGRRTDQLPEEIAWSPRAGFSWTVGGGAGGFQTPPLFVVRGGAGLFRSAFPTSLIGLAQSSTGFAAADNEISCVGPEVPTPDWSTYAGNNTMIPSACLGGGGTALGRAPTATVFAENFKAPKVFNASIGIQRNLTRLLRLSVNARYSRGFDQYGFRDLNLNTTQRFDLTNENGRPVFVAPALIDTRTGGIDFNDSRADSAFGQVLEIGSDLASDTRQLTVSLGGVTSGGVVMQTSYTWARVRDQSSTSARFGGSGLGAQSTGGDPNTIEWARGSFERRHSFLSTIRYPFGVNLEVTAIARLTSGTPYTPMVGNDINGDGARNDRAYIFDPANVSDPLLAAELQSLLDRTSDGARSCLQSQLGRIAERNSCLGPWVPSLDLQLNYRPTVFGLNRRLSLSVSTSNLLRGIDELFHGSENAKGWGLQARPDNRLLFVTGFDNTTQQFTYAVNERFGATQAAANAFRNPFQLAIQARWMFGPDRGRAALDRLRGAGGRGGLAGARAAGGRGAFGPGRAGAGRLTAGGGATDQMVDRFMSLMPNTAAAALELRDSLDLTDAQVRQLESARDSLKAQNQTLAESLREQIAELGTNQDQRAVMGVVQPALADARGNLRRHIQTVRQILTEQQWDALPPQVRNAGRAGRRGPGEI